MELKRNFDGTLSSLQAHLVRALPPCPTREAVAWMGAEGGCCLSGSVRAVGWGRGGVGRVLWWECVNVWLAWGWGRRVSVVFLISWSLLGGALLG